MGKLLKIPGQFNKNPGDFLYQLLLSVPVQTFHIWNKVVRHHVSPVAGHDQEKLPSGTSVRAQTFKNLGGVTSCLIGKCFSVVDRH